MTEPRWLDPELERILDGDPALLSLAESVRASRLEPELDPRFQGLLRARLMSQAPSILAGPAPAPVAGRRARALRPSWWRRPAPFAWGGAAVGVALVAATVLTVVNTRIQDQSVTAVSPVSELHAVSPDNVITVAFSQPMDHSAVVAGLHIRPATEVTTTWKGNNLVITPTHHLVGNTPYTVTIDKTAARSAGGQVASSDIRITFGTAPTPTNSPAVPQLSPQSLGPVDSGGALVDGGGAGVLATSSSAVASSTPTPAATPTVVPATSSAAASASASASASPAASPSAPATAAATATPAAALTGELVALGGSGGVSDLGPAVSSAALSPSGLRLAAAVPTSAGTQLVLVPLDGSPRRVLATLPSAVIGTGWLSNNAAVAALGDRVVSVDLVGGVSTVCTLPTGTTAVVFAPDGAHAYAAVAGQDGQLIDLGSGTTRALTGSRGLAAFSGNGATVAWVDSTTAGGPRLDTSPVGSTTLTTIPYSQPGAALTDLALDQTATTIALVRHPAGGGTATLDLVAAPSGTVIAHGPAARSLLFTGRGKRIAFIAGGTAEAADVPGASGAAGPTALPDGTASMLQSFVDAQVSGNTGTLSSLQGPGVNAVSVTPHGLTRAYVVSAGVDSAGTVTATARLIIDASATRAVASFADETLTLTTPSGHPGYQVTGLTVGATHDEPVGPHVVHVTPSAGSDGKLVLSIAFDSDLKPESVPGAVTVTGSDGSPLPVTVTYEAGSRTATVTVAAPSSSSVTLTVSTSLADVDGQALATQFSVTTGG